MNIDPAEVLRELQALNPVLYDLAVHKVALKKLEDENTRLTEALGERHGSTEEGSKQ